MKTLLAGLSIFLSLAAAPAAERPKVALEPLATGEWADPAPTKGAFEFDPDTFTWKEKSTGRLIDGTASIHP